MAQGLEGPMTIAGISMVRNEADILEASIRHMLNQGVDFLLIADHGSTDGTQEILQSFGPLVEWTVNTDPQYRQVAWMNDLAAEAHARGADWIVPWDADEFWLPVERASLKAVFEEASVALCSATLYHHRDWEWKYTQAERLPKVAFKWRTRARIMAGNHDVEGIGGVERICALEIRHLQYRSAEHFIAKVRDHNSTLTAEMRQRGEGAHKSQYEHLTDEQLLAVYAEMCAQPTVYDPIPCSR